MRRPRAVLFGVLVPFVVACSDQPFAEGMGAAAPGADGGFGVPSTGEGNGGCPPGTRPAQSTERGKLANEGGWTCTQIGQCADGCGSSLSCMGECQRKGCPAASKAFDDLSTCGQGSCISACVGGSSNGCESCIKQKCAAQFAACETNTCGGGASAKPDAGGAGGTPPGTGGGAVPVGTGGVACVPETTADAGVAGAPPPTPPSSPTPPSPPGAPAAPPAAGPANCVAVAACAEDCLLPDCFDACGAKGCESARKTFQAVRTCVTSKCMLDCMFDQGEACTSCVAKKCATQWSACAANKC